MLTNPRERKMVGIKKRNDYGMLSGGFLFDKMDRSALDKVKMTFGIPKKTVLVTKDARVWFKRQVCRADFYIATVAWGTGRDCFYCSATLFQDKKECACAEFTFTFATNHCQI